jgi:hypothetical protein
MPPPSNSSALHLVVLSKPFFVVKLEPGQEITPCVIKDLTDGKGGFFSVTRTPEEVSVVGEAYTDALELQGTVNVVLHQDPRSYGT